MFSAKTLLRRDHLVQLPQILYKATKRSWNIHNQQKFLFIFWNYGQTYHKLKRDQNIQETRNVN